MTICTLEGIVKNYTGRNVLDYINLTISENEKIGVVGVNGTGKSTLLKIIAGLESFEEGNLQRYGNYSIRYLSQNYEIESDLTILEQVFSSNDYGIPIIKEYEDTLELIEQGEDLTDKLLRLQEQIEQENLWDLEHKVKIILSKLGVKNYHEKVNHLSGGERKRVFLAQALLTPCDLLILDEPTNHLDSETIFWLESYLKNTKQALLMVTHDRYFLDKVTNKILEVDDGQIYKFDGNYSYYIEQKATREEDNINKQKKLRNIYKTELEWIKRSPQARSTKQKARIQRFDDLKGSIKDLSKEQLDFSMIGKRLGKSIMEFNNVSKRFDDKILIKDFSYTVIKGDCIGIVGANGAGKTTLLKIINDMVLPDQGEVVKGATVQIGYFTQDTDHMDPKQRMIDYLKEEAEVVVLSNGETLTAGKLLEKFLFDKSSHYTPISKLSGGEQRRLLLLRILMQSPNVILLDEPTNDFDTMTLTVLEDFIDNYNGVVITVSHDRYFLNRVCNKIFSFDEKGSITVIHGDYDSYLKYKKDEKTIKVAKDKKVVKPKLKTGLSFKERKEFETIESVIFDVELQIEEVDAKLVELYTDYIKSKPFIKEKDELEASLDEKMNRWEYLIEKNSNSKD